MKFLRTVQLDGSDRQIYNRCAAPGEWAVPGGFALWDGEPDRDGKAREAFRHGFVGTESFGHSTLVVTADIEPEELEQATQRIAQHLVDCHGAPSTAAARPVAEEEIRFAMELCEHPVGTLIAVDRHTSSEGVEEQFRVIQPDAANHDEVKLWALVDD